MKDAEKDARRAATALYDLTDATGHSGTLRITNLTNAAQVIDWYAAGKPLLPPGVVGLLIEATGGLTNRHVDEALLDQLGLTCSTSGAD